ncbi:hypothetical protein AB5L52_03685 [Streptomyces sp. CG4]|uniref:hypothetical protein n=1 Tax=Streptomyces sp. CG4 TaxID=408783 RepID=UPI0034E1F817
MPTTMTNYAILWTDSNGVPRSSAVAYDKKSADRRKAELQGGGCTEVEIVETKPGTLPEPRG